jgi:ribose/xylose/arabinose/galactoside ABC-type transport system permease subunit
MISLEDKLRPRDDAPSKHLREVLVWTMLMMLGVALLPVWWVDASVVSRLAGGELSDTVGIIEHFSRLLLSFCLLPAMGFMLALRCGAVDLSVWVTASLGGAVTAVMLGAGLNPAVAIFAGMSAGAICGLINGILVAGLRLPCPLVSAGMAFGLIGWMGTVFPSGEVALGDGVLSGMLGNFQSFVNWLGLPEVTLQSVSALGVFVVYSLTMLVILNGEMVERHRGRAGSERWRLFLALTASGVLSAAGGISWLIEHGTAPVSGRPVGDLVIPAAALLAGGFYLAGRGRTLLVGVLLPMSLAVVIGWKQEVMNLRCDFLAGYSLQVAALMVMVAASRYAMTCGAIAPRWRSEALGLALSSSAGIAIFAASVWFEIPVIRDIVRAVGGGLWLVGAAGAIALKLVSSRRVTQ